MTGSAANTGDAGAAGRTERPRGTGVRVWLLVVLTFTAGAVDAICYLALGNVFTSVMTGNLVLLGLDAGEGDILHGLRSSVAIAAYVIAALVAAPWVPHASSTVVWPRGVTVAAATEVVLLAAIATCWIVTGAAPSLPLEFVLITGFALAMGTQTAIGRALLFEGIYTTYVTGMLFGVVADLATHRAGGRSILTRVGVLAAMAAGAAASGALLRTFPSVAPLIPLAATTGVVVVAALFFRAGASRRADG